MSALLLASASAPLVSATTDVDTNQLPIRSLVRITQGRLAGLTGRVLEMTGGNCLIEVPLLGRGVFLRIESQLVVLLRSP